MADLYNEVRPSYPRALIEDIMEMSGIPDGGKILEIGCGPGNATVLFAERGYDILAIELGERLTELARERCHMYPHVRIVCSEFEKYPLPETRFDLAISADAFHWIPPEIGYPKVFQALKPAGSFAMFGYIPSHPQTDPAEEIEQIYRERAPHLLNPDTAFTLDWLVPIIRENFMVYAGVEMMPVRTYTWSERLTAEKYIKLLRTYSNHRGIDETLRSHLYAGIQAVIERFGGFVDQPYEVALFFAKSGVPER